MPIQPIQQTVTPAVMKGVHVEATKAKLKSTATNPMQELLRNNPLLRKHPKLARDALQLLQLKARIRRAGRGRGSKLSRSARRRRLKRHFRHLLKRFQNNLRNVLRHRAQAGKTNQAGTSTNFSFLDDPNLSLDEKIQMFLQKIIEDAENKITEIMKKHANENKPKSKLKKFAAGFVNIASKVGAVVAGVYGGPGAGAAVSMAGSAASQAIGSSGGGSKSSESAKQMDMIKIQGLQNFVKQMLSMVSNMEKSKHDTNMLIAGNLR